MELSTGISDVAVVVLTTYGERQKFSPPSALADPFRSTALFPSAKRDRANPAPRAAQPAPARAQHPRGMAVARLGAAPQGAPAPLPHAAGRAGPCCAVPGGRRWLGRGRPGEAGERGGAGQGRAVPCCAAPCRDGGCRGGESAGGARPGAAGAVQDLPAAVVPAGRRVPAELLQRHGECDAGAAPARPRSAGRPPSPAAGSRSRCAAGGAPAAGSGGRGARCAPPRSAARALLRRGESGPALPGEAGGRRQPRGTRTALSAGGGAEQARQTACLPVPELWTTTRCWCCPGRMR